MYISFWREKQLCSSISVSCLPVYFASKIFQEKETKIYFSCVSWVNCLQNTYTDAINLSYLCVPFTLFEMLYWDTKFLHFSHLLGVSSVGCILINMLFVTSWDICHFNSLITWYFSSHISFVYIYHGLPFIIYLTFCKLLHAGFLQLTPMWFCGNLRNVASFWNTL